MNDNKIMNKAADNIRILAASMVEKAKSGHPGGAMGGADFINTLYSEYLVYDPERPEWEGNVKGAMDGMVFTREIEDDTMPGGPVKRTIEYVAPFDKCDREQDYETAWRFFEEKYGK